MIYMEPSPYVLATLSSIRTIWNPEPVVLFVSGDLTQAWDKQSTEKIGKVLPSQSWGAVLHVCRLLCSRKIDFVHLDGWSGSVMFSAILVAAILRIPITIDTDTPPSGRGRRWKRWLKTLLYPLLFRLPSRFFPFGTKQAQYLRNYGVPPSRIVVTNAASDLRAICESRSSSTEDARNAWRTEHGVPNAACCFLYVGRLETYKGVGDLLEAFLQVRRQTSNVFLVIAGDGTLRHEVAQVANETEAITQLGQISSEDLKAVYAATSVLVLPSHRDNWGMVIGEAMAGGLPVVVSDQVGCVEDLVRPSGAGLIFSARMVGTLAEAMCRLAEDSQLRLEMGDRARRWIASWGADATAERMVSVWRGLRA